MIDPRFTDLTAHLWRGGRYSYFWTPDDGNGDKISYWLTVNAGVDLPKMFSGRDTYFNVNPSNIRRSEHERASIADIAAINCLYCEFDCGTPEAKAAAAEKIKSWPIKPACVIDSGGGYHVYLNLRNTFVLDANESRQRAIDLQWAFAQWAGGDTSVNDLARVLRVPGTYNRKAKYAPDFPIVTIVEWDMTRQYDIADLDALLQPIIDKRDAAKAHSQRSAPGGTVSLSDGELLDVLFKAKNGDLYRRLWGGDDLGDHSRADQILCNGLAWVTGRNIATMDRLFRQSGLMRDKWRDRDAYRENTLNNAADSAQTVYTPGHVDQDAIDAANGAIGLGSQGSNGNGQKAKTAKAKVQKNRVTYPEIARDYIKRQPDTMFARGQWFRYKDGVWADWHDYNVEGEIWDLLEDYADDIYPTLNGVNNVKSNVRSNVRMDEEYLDNDDQLINLRNGTYSLDLRTLLTHDKNRNLTTQLPFNYDENAVAPCWGQYLETTFVDKQGNPDSDLIALAQEAVGYSLTTNISFQVTFWCYGEGANGKGVLFYILEQLAGSSAIPFNVDLLSREQYQLADLAGKRIALCPEASTNGMVEDAIVKALVGGDSLQVRQIRREPFTLYPKVKLWWSMNKLPTVTDTSTGLWRRIKMLPFYADFEGRDRHKRLDDLKERLLDELPGIFNWAMEGLARLTDNGHFTVSKQSIELTNSYRRDANTIASFVEETCDTDPSYNVQSETVYRRYKEWCIDNGYKAYNTRNFKGEMERLKYYWKRTATIRIFEGLRLKGHGNSIP